MTRPRIRCAAAGALLLLAPSQLEAQETADSAARSTIAGPPVRQIATASAISKELIGNITHVRELPDGRVLANDAMRRRLLLMDTSLAVVGVVLDSLAEISNSYGARPAGLIPHRGDSTLFVDITSYTMLVIDPAGKLARARAVPRIDDMYWLAAPPIYGLPTTDPRGRIVYRQAARPTPPKVAPPRGVPWFPQEPDSAFVVAIDLETRKLDTLGVVKVPKSSFQVRQINTSYGTSWSFSSMTNPLPTTDDWALLPDGTVAFVRARDYRVEYRAPDGTWTSGPKLPYPWQRLTDEDKQRIVDSVRVVQNKTAVRNYVSAMIRWVNYFGKKEYPKGFTVPADYVPQNGLARDWVLPPGVKWPEKYIFACAEGETPKITEAPAGSAAPAPVTPPGMPGPPGPLRGTPSCIPSPVVVAGGTAPPPPQLREDGVLPASDLPDYRPPFPTGAVRVDLAGNLWIRTNPVRPGPGGPVFDVIDRKGELVDRLQVPPGYTLVGFGRDKVVYLQMRDAQGVHLTRVRLK